MKRTILMLLLALAFVGILALAMPMTGSAAGSFFVYPPDAHPFGLTYAQWAVKWWQWVLAQPIPTNPNLDLTG